jgi:hypothetical protein
VLCVDGGCVEFAAAGAGAGAVELEAPPLADAPPLELLELPPVADPPRFAPLVAAAPPAVPLAAAAVAALSIPPCPLQAPRPPWGDVVPSLQVTGLAVSANVLLPGSMSNAADVRTPRINEACLHIRIGRASTEKADCFVSMARAAWAAGPAGRRPCRLQARWLLSRAKSAVRAPRAHWPHPLDVKNSHGMPPGNDCLTTGAATTSDSASCPFTPRATTLRYLMQSNMMRMS